MSGIAGIYYLDGRLVERYALQAMLSCISHRGPDGSGIWSAGSVGLAHCMLWTTPEALHERQPKLSAQADFVLTADARIDNRASLIHALSLQIYPPNKISDADIILKAYETWGEQCVDRLVGDFAFAIWDGRQKKLFCARDHLGVKPFYYYQSANIFAFASEIKALWALPEVPRQINEMRIADYLAFQVEDRQVTFFEHIHRLPPASAIKIEDGNSRQRAYWSLDPSYQIQLSCDRDYVDAFKEVFDEAVRCRLRAYKDIGSLLSGGLDSSSIACTARKIQSPGSAHQIGSYSAVFTHLPEGIISTVDERKYIEEALQGEGFLPNFVSVGGLSPLREQSELFPLLDEIYLAPNLYMHLALYRSAHTNGVRVLLDGTDGDATVSHGYEYLSDLARRLKWLQLCRHAIQLSDKEGGHSSTRAIIRKHALRPLIPDQVVHAKRFLTGDRQPQWLTRSVLKQDFADRIHYSERVSSFAASHPGPRTARYQHWRETDSGSTSLSLELVDKLSSALAIELRFPFYDKRLVEFCLALPADQKLSNGWTRAILRNAMEGVLPEGIRWRPSKANFLPAFGLSMLEYDQTILEHYIKSEYEIIEPYVDIARLRDAYSRFCARPTYSALDSQMVFAAVLLAMWLTHAVQSDQNSI